LVPCWVPSAHFGEHHELSLLTGQDTFSNANAFRSRKARLAQELAATNELVLWMMTTSGERDNTNGLSHSEGHFAGFAFTGALTHDWWAGLGSIRKQGNGMRNSDGEKLEAQTEEVAESDAPGGAPPSVRAPSYPVALVFFDLTYAPAARLCLHVSLSYADAATGFCFEDDSVSLFPLDFEWNWNCFKKNRSDSFVAIVYLLELIIN
jgi:hypothetical protein